MTGAVMLQVYTLAGVPLTEFNIPYSQTPAVIANQNKGKVISYC